MAKANKEENLLSYFDFKEKLEKKIKEKEDDYEDKWAGLEDDDYGEDREDTFDDVEKPIKEDIGVDPDLAKMIDDKEVENKELQEKHKDEEIGDDK